MNPIFISTSVLIGSTIVNGACLGTLTYNAQNGGETKAIGQCMLYQDLNGAQGYIGSYNFICDGDTLKQKMYSDHQCQTPLEENTVPVETDVSSTVEAGSCSSGSLVPVDDCDYLLIYEWNMQSNTDQCGTAADAIASNSLFVSTVVKTKVAVGNGQIIDCVDTTGQGAEWTTRTVNWCDEQQAQQQGQDTNVLTTTTYSDNTCSTETATEDTVMNLETGLPLQEDSIDNQGNFVVNYVCRSFVECSSNAIMDAPTDSPTTSPTASPTTAAPTTSPTASPTTAAPTASPTTAAPSASPTGSPTTSAPTTSPTTATTTGTPITSAPSAAPTSATSQTTTAAPTTASSSDTIQSSSIIALLIASFYVIIIA